ncbi:MAG TPA: ModE family transcriptional regulator [Hyphomicrobiaceae bacterium]|nr:ModE family transcriptional regulator [Hyphomicrobiaceae bacterium]
MTANNKTLGARLRIVLAPEIAIGPGKADLLQGIQETGSIAAAGRRMGMSYKRAWVLVETMNRHFAGPLVTASKGGPKGGGAALTALGEQVLHSYRQMEHRTHRAIKRDLERLRTLLADISR